MFFFNISGFVYCGENLMLALEKRAFIYEFNCEIKEPSLHRNLIDSFVED